MPISREVASNFDHTVVFSSFCADRQTKIETHTPIDRRR